MRRYALVLFGYCRRRLGDDHLAEDAVQEVFLRAWRRLAGEEPQNVPGWLFAAARRCCLEIARKRRRVAGAAAIWEDPAAADPPGGAPSNLAVRLERALSRLSDTERALIYMKHMQGLKCREIARAGNTPLGTVTGTLSRAYARLRSALAQREP